MATATASQDVVDRFKMEVTLIQNKIKLSLNSQKHLQRGRTNL